MSANSARLPHVVVLGVEVRFNTRGTAIREGEVGRDGSTIRAGNIVWAAGIGASPVTRSLGVELDRAGRGIIPTSPTSAAPGSSWTG